jgi:2'-5' RNA ligase
MGIGLPETVFKFPLHISLKKSFRTQRFEDVQEDALALLKQHMPMSCQVSGVTLHKNMIWLNITPNASLLKFHQELDALLLSKYGIPIDKFDKAFQPHISLFTSGNRDDIMEMYELLKEENLHLNDVVFHKFVIGSSIHRDTFYEL